MSSTAVLPSGAVKFFVTLGFGAGLGFVLAHLVNQTATGRALFADLDGRLKAFTTAVVDGYTTRDAELRDRA